MAKDDPPKVKQKPGNKGDFHGAREEFWVSQVAVYLAASKAKTDLARWEEAEEGFPSMDPEHQADARTRFTSVVLPLLQALRSYTGFHITLIAGRVDEGKFDLRSLHAGKTKFGDDKDGGQDFTEWDGAGYKNHVLNQFM
ncbi:hypothetical protein K438DRAFT_1786184 [Mycena galopus ATCC 62051]|nr:hypothetical protein K438DRAFT_1786184 [Mycena galopus ATCC 62051]